MKGRRGFLQKLLGGAAAAVIAPKAEPAPVSIITPGSTPIPSPAPVVTLNMAVVSSISMVGGICQYPGPYAGFYGPSYTYKRSATQ